VILESYGSGNAPTDNWFIDLLVKTLKNEIPVVNVTQCVSGKVIMGYYETSSRLQEIGIISGNDITTESAIAKMKYLIGEKVSFENFKMYFETPLRGEMSF